MSPAGPLAAAVDWIRPLEKALDRVERHVLDGGWRQPDPQAATHAFEPRPRRGVRQHADQTGCHAAEWHRHQQEGGERRRPQGRRRDEPACHNGLHHRQPRHGTEIAPQPDLAGFATLVRHCAFMIAAGFIPFSRRIPLEPVLHHARRNTLASDRPSIRRLFGVFPNACRDRRPFGGLRRCGRLRLAATWS